MNEHMRKSLLYERVYSELVNLKLTLTSHEKKERKENQGKVSEHYDIVRKELTTIANKYRNASDDEFNMSKAISPDYDTDGVINLANAVLAQMALDYENALSHGDTVEKSEIDHFANGSAKLYTTLDPVEILGRIAEDHRRFKRKAHECFDEIFANTADLRARGIPFAERRNQYRCPLCRGGMYVKTKTKNNLYVVACSGCSLTETVKRETEKPHAQ